MAQQLATVEAAPGKFVPVERLFRDQEPEGIRQLYFATVPRRCLLDQGEDARGQHVAPDNRQGRGGLGRVRLLYEVHDPMQHSGAGRPLARSDRLSRYDAVAASFGARHPLERNHAGVVRRCHVEQLPRARHCAADNVVGEHDHKRLVTDERRRGQNGVR